MLNDVKHRKVVLRHQQQKMKTHTNETPEFELEKRQYYEKYQKALAKLSEEQRVAFLLNKVEGKNRGKKYLVNNLDKMMHTLMNVVIWKKRDKSKPVERIKMTVIVLI